MLLMLGVLAAGLALAGAVQGLLAARALGRLVAARPPIGPALPASIIKPLHGAEPGLAENLAASLAQEHRAPFEMVMAVANPADAALPLGGALPEPARVIVAPEVLGPNRKVSQLVHLENVALYPVLVAADADMRVTPDWLTAVTAPLADPEVGLVTCLYTGVAADGGFWSRLSALSIDWHFLPNAALGESLGRANGCYGATIAVRREVLEEVGGFSRFLELLADDHALGAAVRRAGYRTVLSPMLPRHMMSEPGPLAMWRHELRWARTIRLLNPAGYWGLGLTHPLPWAMVAAACLPGLWAAGVLGAAMGARLGAVAQVERAIGQKPRLAWLPLRDGLSFAVWLAGLWPGRVFWGRERFRVTRDGRLAR
ncbi:MAG: bacteriohopanetetrol glucosamine biosynthesis glycosyltransferase HpnI [Alphaproteobacteria bacterium]|nr:bacteriohopanetetrol glucosamine biosynthesis glycosyltransferase HpnI [Alphaproteobacteria bacterium]